MSHLVRCSSCEDLVAGEDVCTRCRKCDWCCSCEPAEFDADELGLNPEDDR